VLPLIQPLNHITAHLYSHRTKMADLLPRLLSFSPRLQPSQGISDEDYDAQIRDLVTYLKQTFSGNAVGSVGENESLLEVSLTVYCQMVSVSSPV